jgi:hypothetical protein
MQKTQPQYEIQKRPEKKTKNKIKEKKKEINKVFYLKTP